ncbi:MAG TPA: hypothetical protein VH437_14155 [Terriglobales bacterium]|jgi:hypothetical protein
MNTLTELPHAYEGERESEQVPGAEQTLVTANHACANNRYEREQLQFLVRQIFFPGWSKSVRQVVFSSVDQQTRTLEICLQVAATLEAQSSGRICLVQTDESASAQAQLSCNTSTNDKRLTDLPVDEDDRGNLWKSSQQISDRTWLMTKEIFLQGCPGGHSAAWLRGRVERLRLEFDYTLLQAPPLGISSEAAVFGNLLDGVILLLNAGTTRRMAAQNAKSVLQVANARLLGTILTERTFPIPERIYRRV